MAPSSSQEISGKNLTILHFNDVYNIDPGKDEPVGGAARFSRALKSFEHENPLILFSGDAFAPSYVSTFTKGEHMVPVLNACNVHCAVYGNHDFDFGIDILMERAKATKFPWLMSNVLDTETRRLLADGQETKVIDWHGIRVGLIGLVEKEWLDTLSAIDPGHVIYTDFVQSGRQLARKLRDEDNCQLVVALTHMRTPNDIRLANEVEEIDLILGGHDHVAEQYEVDGRYVIKSGTDFRQFSIITVNIGEQCRPVITVQLVDVTSKFAEDEELKTLLDSYSSVINEKMTEVLGNFGVPLDGRFSSVRTMETNLGNFICDIMVACTESDLALLNSGTLRSDRIHPAGPFTLGDLNNVLPMLDPLLVLEISGEDLLTALENGVSQYPRLEGRFPQVSGVHFAFDPTRPAGNRVNSRYVRIGDEYLDLKQKYRMVTKAYMKAGKDGYDVIRECKILMDEEDCPTLCNAIQNHFRSIQTLCGKFKRTRHRQSLVTLSRRHSVVKALDGDSQSEIRVRKKSSVDVPTLCNGAGEPEVEVLDKPVRFKPPLRREASLDEIEFSSCKLEPTVEGRIMVLDEILLSQLEKERLIWETRATPTIRESIEI